jgi:hypothetical protein
MELIQIVNYFLPNWDVLHIKPFGNGHINSTYKVVLMDYENEFILQKINTKVFTSPENIIQNHFKLQTFLSSQNSEFKIPHLLPTTENKYLYVDENNDAWRMMNFIKDSYSIEIVKDNNQAYEAGRGFGWFLNEFSIKLPSEFKEAIKDFHSLSFRLDQFNQAILKDKAKRLAGIVDVVDFYKDRERLLLKIEELIRSGEIPLRISHNDTKINNLLFRNNKAVAVIDLDTIGPGSVIYDFGDALRTICNTAAEDEMNISKVNFNLESFEYFTKGYLEKARSILNKVEIENLYIAPVYMTYIMGIRFLADYLNGDVYYKTTFSEHNLIRCLVQKKLIEQMEIRKEEMINCINSYIT